MYVSRQHPFPSEYALREENDDTITNTVSALGQGERSYPEHSLKNGSQTVSGLGLPFEGPELPGSRANSEPADLHERHIRLRGVYCEHAR